MVYNTNTLKGENTMTTGERIKRTRQLNGLTQEELAKKVGYKSGKQAISQIERGLADIPLAKLKLIAEALGVTTSYLAGYETEEQSALQEEYMIALMSMLNAKGKELARNYIEGLLENPNLKVK